jgi:hypothetical protein
LGDTSISLLSSSSSSSIIIHNHHYSVGYDEAVYSVISDFSEIAGDMSKKCSAIVFWMLCCFIGSMIHINGMGPT